MLKMKPSCECCDVVLPADSDRAMICSFECTFCIQCIGALFGNRCPNCGGPVTPRPAREGQALAENPASTDPVRSDYVINVVRGKKSITRQRLSEGSHAAGPAG